ncbi:hypothetical protein [Terasakiella pusilla]|uniref:hypothetical protein n=1 Tax=Terasakiella pusilla TaxID=64973 RepID=UPI003AA7E1DC
MFEVKIGEVSSSTETMSWLEFVASLVGNLAWPVAAVIIAFAFKKQISNLLSKIQKLSWGDNSIELAEKLDNAEAIALTEKVKDTSHKISRPQDGKVEVNSEEKGENADIENASGEVVETHRNTKAQNSPTISSEKRFQKLLMISPAAAILDSWAAVEKHLYSISAVSDEERRRNPSIKLINNLMEDGLINSSEFTMLRELQNIRNSAAHNVDVSVTDAYRFYTLSEKVMKVLEDLKR